MSYEIRGLIGILWRDCSNCSTFDQARIQAVFAMPEGTDRAPLVGDSEDKAEHSREVVATPSIQTQSSDRSACEEVVVPHFWVFIEGSIFWKISLDLDSRL